MTEPPSRLAPVGPVTFDPQFLSLVSDGRRRLSISREYEDDPAVTFPVLLFVPDASKSDHEHIVLDDAAAEKLFEWLGAYFSEKRKYADGGG